MAADGQDSGALRREVRAWLERHWDPARRDGFTAAVVDARWAVPRWPAAWYGRELTDDPARVIEEEFRRVGAPGAGQDRRNLFANTVLAFGSDETKGRFLRPILSGELRMCLLYSEPEAGSDLAGVQTTAVRDGEGWVVDGQKLWTSGAATADYGMLVARTDWDVPKHRGISFFLFPMKQPGVEVRPLRQITGESHFNEVFITGAVVPHANMLGEPGAGWRVLQTALAYERAVMGNSAPQGRAEKRGVVIGDREPDLIGLARTAGRIDDPVLRQEIARVNMLRAVLRWNNERARAELKQGTSSSALSVGKLAMSRVRHEGARVQAMILGAESMLDGPDRPRADAANFQVLNAYFTSIGGGTDQIQRNIIGERVLGLPKEPETDRDIPFRQARRAGRPQR